MGPRFSRMMVFCIGLLSFALAGAERAHAASSCLQGSKSDDKQICFVGPQDQLENISPAEFEAQQRALRAELERRVNEARARLAK
jgi:hypothetical protein